MSTAVNYLDNVTLYEGGFSGSVVVPDGAYNARFRVQGAGGSGKEQAAPGGPGGGGGGYTVFETPILEVEWGTSVSLVVGSAVADSDGEDSTVTGTLNGVAFSLTGGGGNAGNIAGAGGSDGTGGTASGGTTDYPGSDATGYVPSPPDERMNGTGGNGGGSFESDYSTLGRGGNGTEAGGDTSAEDGYIVVEWA